MRARHGAWLWIVAAVAGAGCGDAEFHGLVNHLDGGPNAIGEDPVMALPDDQSDIGEVESDAGVPCRPIQAQPTPVRKGLMSLQAENAMQGAAAAVYTTAELFRDFDGICGACHGALPASGTSYSVPNVLAFQALVTEDTHARMTVDDQDLVMPRGGKLLSQRGPDESVSKLEKRLAAWLAADKAATFADPVPSSAASAVRASFVLTAELGESLTNMGSCVPSKSILATEVSQMDVLDTTFSSMKSFEDLPRKLSQTDLFTLDNAALARQGVLSYAPGYPLWSDDAHKMRYIRVPHGQSIAFSVAEQSFDIPDNTRFYKTFLKDVTELDGSVGYRKIETRLIVVRRSEEKADGLPDIHAIYGTYAWNDDESEAELVTDTYRDGSPFRDRVITYTKNEQIEQKLLEQNDPDVGAQLISQGAQRHYAIPGSERCVQCHMGGADNAFVLGFSPLQIMRRALGEGGVIEPAEPDELNQLQRFIDYGLITGVDSASKVVPLEKSQGARSPRTDSELVAQGYMLGNCAHCHNPNGYPTRTAPALRGVLDFMPSADDGGIFEFPLDKVSPRIQRHTGVGPVNMPYITPSLYDLGTHDFTSPTARSVPYDWLVSPQLPQILVAPWRSLIYRNVDTAFTYSDGDAIYPHMPMNTAGYDCRAPHIMATWMLSIPALPKTSLAAAADTSEQPFREVVPGDPLFADAKLSAAVRLQDYRNGSRYLDCPDTGDILSAKDAVLNPTDLDAVKFGIPHHPHWVETDLSPDPRWLPRNPTWNDVLVDQNYEVIVGESQVDTEQKQMYQSQLVPLLDSVTFSPEMRDFALREVPFGLWREKASCSFPGVQTVASVPANPEWDWLETNRDDPTRHVYTQSTGAAIFNMVCVNCHGPSMDAKGRQADTVALLSGGKTRVANWRDGFFGPVGDVRANREGQFSVPASGASVDDWAARYMSWMALGGTTAQIPATVLNVVGSNPVLGVPVQRGVSTSPNMLELAKATCGLLLPAPAVQATSFLFLDPETRVVQLPTGQFPSKNGDTDLWKRVCSFQNLPPIRVLRSDSDTTDPKTTLAKFRLYELARRKTADGKDIYPAGSPVLDEYGVVQPSLTDANRYPICLGRYPLEAQNKAAEKLVADDAAKTGKPPLPFCPASLLNASGVAKDAFAPSDEFKWVYRGAINAGFSVYAYADAVTSGSADVTVHPDFDQCEKLEMSTTP